VGRMATYLLRCALPDRPGALGLVASRIGAVRGDIVSIAVRRRLADSVIDEFRVVLPDDTRIELLQAEVAQVDGVRIESCEPAGSTTPSETGSGLVWLEILVDDVEAAAAYYRDALGWTSEPFGLVGGGGYRLLSPRGGEPPLGALVHSVAAVPTDRPSGPVPYVEVDDLDAVLRQVDAAGGQVREPSSPFGEAGRFAIVADRWGNRLGLWCTATD
jgi:predicted enzyme related to lactoylglutathione lyase